MAVEDGLLIVNLGTPDDPRVSSVRRYLKQFLSDPRVLDLPTVARWLLVNLVILPTRPRKSAEAYQKIWTEQGSPLQFLTRDLTRAIEQELDDPTLSVRYAMRYQKPSLAEALDAFRREGVRRLTIFPLYGQYAASSTGSCLEEIYRICGSFWNVPALTVIPPFFDQPDYLDCLAELNRESLGDLTAYDHFLVSFHGLPERHVRKSDLHPSGRCLSRSDCCELPNEWNRYCYRAHCVQVARALTDRLGISSDSYTIGFQSRLGRTPWIQPYTDELFETLPKQGVKRLAVMIPSFTVDCLETLEEIAIRGKEAFLGAGGAHFHMVPALNADRRWVETAAKILKPYLALNPRAQRQSAIGGQG